MVIRNIGTSSHIRTLVTRNHDALYVGYFMVGEGDTSEPKAVQSTEITILPKAQLK